MKRLLEQDGDFVLVEWERLIDPGSYTCESVSNLQNDLGINVFTDFLDALPHVPEICKQPSADRLLYYAL